MCRWQSPFVKVALIAAIIIAGLDLGQAARARSAEAPVVPLTFSGFIAALVAALWAYDGWNNVSMVSSEIQDPQRNLPLRLDRRNLRRDRHLFAGQLRLISTC